MKKTKGKVVKRAPTSKSKAKRVQRVRTAEGWRRVMLKKKKALK